MVGDCSHDLQWCLCATRFYPLKIDARVSLYLLLSYIALSLHLVKAWVLQSVCGMRLAWKQCGYLLKGCLACGVHAHTHFCTGRSWCEIVEGNFWCGIKEFLLRCICKVQAAFLTIKIATVPFVYVTLRAWFVSDSYNNYCLLILSVARIAWRHSAHMKPAPEMLYTP